MKRILSLLLVMLLAVTLFAGIGRSEIALAAEEDPLAGKTVAVNVPTLAYEFFAKIGTDMQAIGEERGFKVVVDSCDGNQSTQSDQLINYTTMGVDYVAVVPVETTGCLDAMKQMKDAGITVINLLGSLVGYEESYSYSIVQDEFEVGKGAAEIAAEWIEANFPDAEDGSIGVAIFEKNTDPDAIARSEGLHEIENLTSKAKLLVSYDFDNGTDADMKAQEYADMMFVQYPDIKCIISYQASYATSVDEVALKQVGLNGEEFGIFSVDWTELLGAKLASSPDGDSYIRGTSACWVNLANNIVALIDGELPIDENNEFASGSWKVTPDTLQDYLDIIS